MPYNKPYTASRRLPENRGTFLGTPSLLLLSDGSLLVSHDYFGWGQVRLSVLRCSRARPDAAGGRPATVICCKHVAHAPTSFAKSVETRKLCRFYLTDEMHME